jgi:hypothetical protein
MDNLARNLDQGAVVQELGTVVGADGAALAVRTAGGEYQARRAAACLLAPEVGDLVIVASLSSGAAYVLSVLERAAQTPSVLTADGDLAVRLPGTFTVAAQERVELVAGKGVQVVAGTFDVNAVEGNFVFARFALVSSFVRAEVDRVKAFAASIDSVVDRVTQRVKRVYRSVEETDQLRAGRIDYVAANTMSLHAENAVVTAEQLVKVDAEQVHVG